MTNLYIRKHSPLADAPARATPDSAGMDVRACLWEPTVTVYTHSGPKQERQVIAGTINIYPGERMMIPTALSMSVDAGYCIKFYPRSGLSLKNGVTLINAVAVGDRDYENEYYVLLTNLSGKVASIADGERICQLMVERVEPVTVVEVEQLPDINSQRNGGMGSTGRN